MFNEDINELLRWGWIVLAVFFFLTEVFTAGFVLLCFGIGALGAALMAFLGAGLAWQIAVFIVVSIAVVLQTVDPIANTGMVRLESERWRAESLDGEQLEVGEVVEVIGVEGVRLQVRATDRVSAESDEQAESAA